MSNLGTEIDQLYNIWETETGIPLWVDFPKRTYIPNVSCLTFMLIINQRQLYIPGPAIKQWS